jgi:hypothetical protein
MNKNNILKKTRINNKNKLSNIPIFTERCKVIDESIIEQKISFFYQDLKIEEGTAGSFLDASFEGLDLSNLQVFF